MFNRSARLFPLVFMLLIPATQLQAADAPATTYPEIEKQQITPQKTEPQETRSQITENQAPGSQAPDPQETETHPQIEAPPASYISFDYVDFNYTSSTIDLSASPKKIEGNGFGFALSLGFNPHYTLTLSVDASTFDNFQHQPIATIKKTKLGITAHTQITDITAIYGNASALVAETTVNENSEESGQSGMGYELRVGLRHMVSRSTELEVAVTNFYVLEYPANSLNIIARYYVRRQISIGFGYRTGNNQDTIALLARASF